MNKTRVDWQRMHVARSRHMGSAHKILVGKPKKGIEHLEDVGTDVRITFRHLHVIECGGVD